MSIIVPSACCLQAASVSHSHIDPFAAPMPLASNPHQSMTASLLSPSLLPPPNAAGLPNHLVAPMKQTTKETDTTKTNQMKTNNQTMKTPSRTRTATRKTKMATSRKKMATRMMTRMMTRMTRMTTRTLISHQHQAHPCQHQHHYHQHGHTSV